MSEEKLEVVKDVSEGDEYIGDQLKTEPNALSNESHENGGPDEPHPSDTVPGEHLELPDQPTKHEDIPEDVQMPDTESLPPDDTVKPAVASPSPVPPPMISTLAPAQFSEVPDYRTKFIFSGHRRSISSVKFNPAGTILASAGRRVIVCVLVIKLRGVFAR